MEKTFKPENLKYLFREKRNKGSEFTVKSLATNKDYSFKISRKEYKGQWYTHVYVEMGYLHFKHIGIFYNNHVRKNTNIVDTPAANAISWILRQVEREHFNKLEESVELKHFGHCIVCGKTLTDDTSIEFGIGPICRKS